jgi:hypothetical protein
MSEGLWIAVIGAIGTIVAALVTAWINRKADKTPSPTTDTQKPLGTEGKPKPATAGPVTHEPDIKATPVTGQNGGNAQVSRESVLEAFGKLRRRTGGAQRSKGRAPHKPLLVLYALGRLLKYDEDSLSFASCADELDGLLHDFCSASGPEYPFWRLKNDGVWEVKWNGPADAEQPTRRELVDGSCRGSFSAGVLSALRNDAALKEELAKRMLESFPAEQHPVIRQRLGLPA